MSLEGVLNIDKPSGITSHDVVNRIRKLSGIRRVGHAGTLDPLATGVLLLCLARATRLTEYLVGQSKSYVATVRLGQVTDTYDADGEIVAQNAVHVSPSDIEQALPQFRGRIQQKAPIYSAIKRGGQPLYKLARQGKDVEPPLREVTIYNLQLLAWEEPSLQLKVVCSAGTYIRALAHDLGEVLGCGGHITALRRTAVGNFSVDQAIPLADLAEDDWTQHLQPSDTAVQHLPRLDLSLQDAQRVQFGQRLPRHEDHPHASLVRLYEPDGQFLGVATARENTWQPHKVFLLDP
jgi:tRNA pseudouridine55 synthase